MDPPPRFVVHLGDIVHPVPALPTFHEAVAHFRDIVEPLEAPLYLVPGNHDVGDKRVDWMPADQVCDAYLQTYRDAFGPDYHAFDIDCRRFVFLNSLLLNSGLVEEEIQRSWLEAQIDGADGRRVLLFMHYPPFVFSEDERGSYDNVDEPARSWLLAQIRREPVEAVFAGHVHNFWYDRIGEAEMYMLPSTAFLRHDFSEFSRTDPGFEFGRGDAAKFGYFRVDVFADDHVAYSVRSHGERCAPGQNPTLRPAPPLAHPKTSGFVDVGVELRHPWTEAQQIPATGGVQEFGRKWARNDYPLLALWEMGVRLAKVPDVDVTEASSRHRMQLMHRIGQRYIVTVLGSPSSRLQASLQGCGVAALELNMTLSAFEACRESLAAVREATGIPMYLSPIHTDASAHFDGRTFSHFVNAGFSTSWLEEHGARVASAVAAGEIDGVTVRLEIDEPLVSAALALNRFRAETGAAVLVSLKLSGPGLATDRDDDAQTAGRTALALVLSRCTPGVSYVFDTFMDVDRGYFPRRAFIDRRFNPRPAAVVYAALVQRFPAGAQFEIIDGDDAQLCFAVNGRRWRVLCGHRALRDAGLAARTHVVDLFAGDAQEARTWLVAGREPGPAQVWLVEDLEG